MVNRVAHYPRFLGIGAARAGTTWLSEQLKTHSDVWIPAIKELHYFTRSTDYIGPSQMADGTLAQRLFSREQAYRQYRRVAGRALASTLLRPSLNKLMWNANYLLRPPGDYWYSTLFSQGYGKVTGEITPRYSMLEHDDIRNLKNLIPDLKLILIMRDPVERAWSLIKYHEKRSGSPLTKLPLDQLRAMAFASVIVQQSDYEAILNRWRSVFPQEQFLEIFFDEICEQPDALLGRIQRFLGIPLTELSEPRRNGRVNGSFRKSMPEELRAELIAHYRPMVERLSDEEGGYFSRWLECYDAPLLRTGTARPDSAFPHPPGPVSNLDPPPLNL